LPWRWPLGGEGGFVQPHLPGPGRPHLPGLPAPPGHFAPFAARSPAWRPCTPVQAVSPPGDPVHTCLAPGPSGFPSGMRAAPRPRSRLGWTPGWAGPRRPLTPQSGCGMQAGFPRELSPGLSPSLAFDLPLSVPPRALSQSQCL
jgi:hypothetical protein